MRSGFLRLRPVCLATATNVRAVRWQSVAAPIDRGTRKSFAQGDVGQRDGVLRGGREKFGVGGRVAVERQLRQSNTVRRRWIG